MIQDPATDREAQIQRRIAELKREDLIQQRIEELKRGQAAPVETADWESVYGAPTATAEAPPAAPEVQSGALSRFGRGAAESLLGAPGQAVEGLGVLFGSEGMQEAGKAIQPEFLDPAERDTTAANLGNVTGSGLSFMIPGGALGVAGKSLGVAGKGLSLLRAGTVATQATLQAMPDAFYSAKANGASDQKAWWSALSTSALQGGVEIFGPQGKLLDKLVDGVSFADKATGGAVKAMLTSTLEEVGEGIIGNVGSDLIAQRLYDTAPDQDWATILGNAAKQIPYDAFGGAVISGAAVSAAKIRDEINRPPGIPQTEPDRTPPVYDPIERDLTPEETVLAEGLAKTRGATEWDMVERPEMTEATELARGIGMNVLFMRDNGSGKTEALVQGDTAIFPADADAETVGLTIATHEYTHGLPEKQKQELIKALMTGESTKDVHAEARAAYEAKRAEENKRLVEAGQKPVKLSKADLDEEAAAEIAGALSPVVLKVTRNEARAVALMTDKPGVMVKVLDIVRKWAGKSTHAEMVAKEIEELGAVRSELVKGMTGRQRVLAAQRIVAASKGIDVAMKQPIRPRLKASAEPIGPAAAPEPTAVEARGEDVPVDPGLGALRAKDEPAPAPVVSAKTKTLQESLDERAVSARGRATEKEARAQAIESRPRVTKAARRRAARLRNQAKMLNEGAASMETQSKALAWKNRDPNEQKSPGDRVRFEDGREGTVASSHEDGSLRVRVQRPPGKGESAEDAARVMYDYVTVRAPDVLRVEAARPVEQSQAKAAPVAKDAPVPVRTEKPIALTASKEAIANEFDKLSKKQTHYMGHKGDFFKKAANWLAGNLDLRGVKTIYDMYAGGGTYGLTYALSGVAPDVQRVVVNEVDAIRRHKFDIARRHGGDIMDPWDTSPFLIELRNTIDALVAGNDSTSPASLAIDTITGAESAKGAYEQYLPMRSRYQALSIDEKAALLALRDVMFSGRTATVAKLFENARQDADNVRLLVKRAAARGIKVEVVSMDALGPEAIKMVHGGGRSFVVLDPPYHGTASGNYSAGGKKYDFKSDEFLQMNLAAAKEMSRGNTVLYNNAATDGVRAGALAAFGSQMQTFEWLRQKRGDAPAQQEFLGVIDNGQGKSSGSRSNVGVGSASPASGEAGGNGGVLATARGDGRGQAGTGATGDARGARGGDARYSLASDAGAQGEDVEAARKAWKEQGTESPWFRRWFGASKVVDGDGKPLVVYHGTGRDFTAFESKPGRHPSSVMGFFFHTDPKETAKFGRISPDGGETDPRTMPVYLSIQNPHDISWKEFQDRFVFIGSGVDRNRNTEALAREFRESLEANGFDGIRITGAANEAEVRKLIDRGGEFVEDQWIAFRPEQVKSALGNRGTFSPANPDIRYSLKPTEALGVDEENIPRGSKAPNVDWESPDLQDSGSRVTPQSVLKDYGTPGVKAHAYRTWVTYNDIPNERLVEEEERKPDDWDDDEMGEWEPRQYDWSEYSKRNTFPPAKLRVTKDGEVQILDGNHRLRFWGEAGFEYFPAIVIDERPGRSRDFPRYSLKSDIESVAADLSEPEGYQPAVASEEMPSRMVAKYVRAMNPVERKGVEEMMAEADAILADRGAREKLARRAMNHEALNEGEQIALQRIASLKATNAWRQGASMDNAVEAQFAFQQARTTAGRVLGNPALRDALQSPAERAMGLALSPSKQVARAYKKAKTWQARRAIVEEEARKIERIRYSLAQKGFDPALIPDDYFKDPTFRNVWAESVADAKANGKWDWYIQWRRAAMLSGPITTIRNVTGNTSYVTYDRIARIWADAVIPGTGTSVEDARVYTRDLFAGIAQGWKDARAAYSAFYDASTEGTSLDEHATFRRGPIMVGLEAVGIRAQAAQDIFFRSVVGAAETRLRARQKARAEGGSAEDYMSDPDVLAMSKEDMERALFLDRDALTRSITGARDWLDEKARFPVGTTIVPFAATPTKIVQRGGETLLGPLGGYMRDREKWGGVLLGAGAWAAMVWAASMFDDDDGLPLITGSRARGGQGDFQDRTAPAYSIRIGDEYYSYQTIEPLSTALAAIADAVQSKDPMKSVSSFAAAAKDKSFFRSVETVYDAIVGAANGERGSDRAKQVARDLLWTPMIPNIVRAPVRAADDTRRKELGNPLEVEDFANAAFPSGDFGPPLRYDLWGRPAEKAGGSWVSRVLAPAMGTKDVEDVEKIDLLLADYNRKADEDKFFSAPAIKSGDRYWTEEEYSELTRDAGAQALTILRPWAANKTELTERDLKHISDVLSKTRARKVEELLRR